MKINDKSPTNDLLSEMFFFDFLNEDPTRSFLHLEALVVSFSKLFLYAQIVHLLRVLFSLNVCQQKTKIWAISIIDFEVNLMQ